VPTDPLNICARPVVEIKSVKVPIVIRAVSFFLSGDLNDLIAK